MRLSRRGSLAAITGSVLASSATADPSDDDDDPPMPLKLVVLDIGGTLIADHGEVPDAMLGAFARNGITVTPQEFSEWRGASKRTMVRHFVARAKKGEALIEPMKDLRAMDLILATTTGFDGPLTKSIIARLGWQHYFVANITSDDVTDGRPAPYMLFRAMEAAHINETAVVMAVGDTPLDLQAASNGGMGAAIGVYSGAATEDRLRKERNSGVLPSVAELPDLIQRGLPLSHCR
jgi:phosphoglycolate phosphatase-like HAD superfamily hydrolase